MNKFIEIAGRIGSQRHLEFIPSTVPACAPTNICLPLLHMRNNLIIHPL